jgi:hypothetical protein
VKDATVLTAIVLIVAVSNGSTQKKANGQKEAS